MIRRKFVRFLNAVIVISFVGLFLVHFQNPYPSTDEHPPRPAYNIALDKQFFSIAEQINHGSEISWPFETAASPLSKDEIVRSIEFLNANYEILNIDKFGPLRNVETIIVVQVHDRLEYLKDLISTLKDARYIETTLLIFSHDYSSEAINKLVKGITFCRVMQIFYPYSIQLFPNVYPGQDPADCPEKATREEAAAMKCNNWKHPDKYGNFRVARVTQIKHHWWWKMNYVFDGILKQYTLTDKWVILLEEDHYVSPDFLHVMRLIMKNKEKYCLTCQVISLGLYLKDYRKYKSDLNRLGIHPWFSSKHNMGMVINADTWKLIKNCTEVFCKYDDYNWDWSLLHVSTSCLPSRLRVIVVKAPRVLHVGDCGVHTHRCTDHNAAKAAATLFASVADSLFPNEMVLAENLKRTLKPSKENGGWGDTRDHELCLNNSRVPNLASYYVDLHSSPVGIDNWTNTSQSLIFPL